MKEFAAAERARTQRALASPRQRAASDPDSAASRAYYAAFHALTAMFACQGRTFSKHTAIRAALHRDLIHTGLLGASVARDYDFLLDLRDVGDYGGVTPVPAESASLAVGKADAFLGAVLRACPSLAR